LECWSIGVLDVIKTKVDKPGFRQSNAVIIGSVNVIEQYKLSQVMANQFDYPNSLGIVFSNTP
jgi:hypothetical protein